MVTRFDSAKRPLSHCAADGKSRKTTRSAHSAAVKAVSQSRGSRSDRRVMDQVVASRRVEWEGIGEERSGAVVGRRGYATMQFGQECGNGCGRRGGRGFSVVPLRDKVKDTSTDGKEKRSAVSYGGHVTRGKACGNRRGSKYGQQQRVNVEFNGVELEA